MLYGHRKPTIVKIIKKRFRYPKAIPLNKPLFVIGCTSKFLLVADELVIKVYKVLWKDIELVECEKIIQTPVVNQETTVVKQKKERSSIFK